MLDLLGKDAPAGDERMDPAATLSAAGLAAAVGTVATGVTDWTVSDGEDRRVGLFHGLLNAAGVALQAASLAARLTGHRRPARALGVTSMAVTAAAGFVGGHLVQGRAVMVNRVAATTGPTPLGPHGRRRPTSRTAARSGSRSRAGRCCCTAQTARCTPWTTCAATRAPCSAAGEVDGCVVTCPLHESRFDLRDGRIVRGPAHHPQPVLPARTRNGWIEVRGSQPRPRTRQNQRRSPWRGKR